MDHKLFNSVSCFRFFFSFFSFLLHFCFLLLFPSFPSLPVLFLFLLVWFLVHFQPGPAPWWIFPLDLFSINPSCQILPGFYFSRNFFFFHQDLFFKYFLYLLLQTKSVQRERLAAWRSKANKQRQTEQCLPSRETRTDDQTRSGKDITGASGQAFKISDRPDWQSQRMKWG